MVVGNNQMRLVICVGEWTSGRECVEVEAWWRGGVVAWRRRRGGGRRGDVAQW